MSSVGDGTTFKIPRGHNSHAAAVLLLPALAVLSLPAWSQSCALCYTWPLVPVRA